MSGEVDSGRYWVAVVLILVALSAGVYAVLSNPSVELWLFNLFVRSS